MFQNMKTLRKYDIKMYINLRIPTYETNRKWQNQSKNNNNNNISRLRISSIARDQKWGENRKPDTYKRFFWIFFLSLFERPTYFWIPYIQTKISGTFSKILNKEKFFIAFSVKKSKSKGKQGKMFQKIYKLVLSPRHCARLREISI